MIGFIDIEHADNLGAASGERLLAARARLTYMLEDVSGEPCMLLRYNKLTIELTEQLGIRALFLSGNAAPMDMYDQTELDLFFAVLRDAGVPIFGFCGGMQFVALAFGADVVAMDEKEAGRLPIEITVDHPVLAGVGSDPVFRHAHGLHVPVAPEGFSTHARTAMTEIQMFANDEHKIVGTQFHPEYFTDEYPAGRVMIENFLDWIAD